MSKTNRQGMLPGMESQHETPDVEIEGPRDAMAKEDSEPSEQPAPAALPDLKGKTVWIVDANSLIFQVFHALPEMTSPRGQPVNAVYGFTRDVLFLLEEKHPDYFFCAFDLPGPTFRHKLYAEYKAQRKEMPEDLRPQMEIIQQVLASLSAPVLSLESFEADDILATVARLTEELGGECFVVTGDKDCRQLITDRVRVYNARKNQVYDHEALAEDWGVRPDQVVDFQSLVGDSVDNVPGVPLIGPKIARELLERYDTLEGVLDHADEVSGKKRKQNLIDFREQALMSRKLVRLDGHAPLEIDWQRGEVSRFQPKGALDLFVELGFHTFADKLREKQTASQAPEPWRADYRLVETPEKLKDLVARLAEQERFSFDTETTHVWPTWAEIVGYSFAWREGEAYYVPVRSPEGEPNLDPAATLEALRPVLENPAIEKVGQNLKYDTIVLRTVGVVLAGAKFDTMLASYLLEAGERNHNMDELAKRHLQHETIKITDLIGTGKNQKRMDEVPLAAIAPYAAEDADVPWRLRPILLEMLRRDDLDTLYRTLEEPLIDVLVELECNGIRIDLPRLAELSERFAQRLGELEREIYELAGREFNIASPKQLQQVLFDEQKLPPQKRTKSGPSTDASVLESLAGEHPLPAKILEFRQYAKLKGTYVDALPAMVNPRTGRVHTSFNQSVAATGRLSASDPNLQNIPIRSEVGREIRSAFLPAEGCALLAADYSQIELRVLAHFSGDETMRAAFANDEDIHARVASEVYKVPLGEVTKEMRRNAKAVNFGIVYGQSPFGLAKQLHIDKDEAAEFIEAYFARYAGVEDFLAKTLADCAQNGYVKTIMGRRRAIHGIRPDARRQRNLPERTAVNTVIQGSAADLIKLAMIRVYQRLAKERSAAKMLLQIHDELVFEAPQDHLAELADLVAHEMSAVASLTVPLKVDLSFGANWADLHSL